MERKQSRYIGLALEPAKGSTPWSRPCSRNAETWPTFRKTWWELRESFDGSYAREVAQLHRDKPIGARLQILKALPEYRKRQLYALTCAKWIVITVYGVLCSIFLVGRVFLGIPLDKEINPTVGSYHVPDSLLVVAIVLFVLVPSLIGWRIGTYRADRRH